MRGQDLSAATGYTTQRSSILPLYEVSDPLYTLAVSQNKKKHHVCAVECAIFGQFPIFREMTLFCKQCQKGVSLSTWKYFHGFVWCA